MTEFLPRRAGDGPLVNAYNAGNRKAKPWEDGEECHRRHEQYDHGQQFDEDLHHRQAGKARTHHEAEAEGRRQEANDDGQDTHHSEVLRIDPGRLANRLSDRHKNDDDRNTIQEGSQEMIG
jgi:hypothetical protein